MIRQIICMAVCLGATVAAQTFFDNAMTITFGQGGAVRIYTESTIKNSPRVNNGVAAIDEGDVSHRMVVGPKGKVLFAYNLSLAPHPDNPGVYTLRATPAEPEHFLPPQYLTFEPGDRVTLTAIRATELNATYTVRPDGKIRVGLLGDVQVAGQSRAGLAAELQKLLEGRIPEDDEVSLEVSVQPREYPTIAGAREFPEVRVGETVKLEVLSDPASGEKLFDVIQPVEPPVARNIAPEDEMVLDRMRILINGKTIKELSTSTMIGEAAKLSLASLGTVYLVAKPLPGYPFQPVGRVQGETLTFPVGNDTVEIVARSNVLKTSDNGAVWVYYDLASKPTAAVTAEVGMPGDILPSR